MLNLFLFTLTICVICTTISEVFKNNSEARYYESCIRDNTRIVKLEKKIASYETQKTPAQGDTLGWKD